MAGAFSNNGAALPSSDEYYDVPGIETLKRRWHKEMRFLPFSASLSMSDRGLVLGAGTILAPMVRDQYARPSLVLDGREEHILALLSLGFQKCIPVKALTFIKRASAQWAKGDKVLAHLELAYARLPKFETREDAWLLFCVDGLIAGGMSPRGLMGAIGLDTQEFDLLKYAYDPNQLRVPAGNGRASGEWTTGVQYAQNSRTFPRNLPYVGGRGGGGGAGPGSFSSEDSITGEPVFPTQISPSSRALGRALEEAGQSRPTDSAAHHIVAGSAPDAQAARSILNKYNIGINDAENGVFLQTETHSGIHTSKYYDAVNQALSNAGSRDEAIRILNSIKESVKAGRFPE